MPTPWTFRRSLRGASLPLLLTLAACTRPTPAAAAAPALEGAVPQPTRDEAAAAFEALLAADHWRERNAARDRLIALGAPALEVVLGGTRHADDDVRLACYEVLRERFPTDARSVEALLAGLRDPDVWWIAYPWAFHMGEHGVRAAVEPLDALVAAAETDELVRYAAAKSLAELGVREGLMVLLWQGLGSEVAYTRYLSNLGAKALTDRDLTDFDYEGPWEGAFVSGPAVGTLQGQPLEKAERRVRRWRAVADFTRWLRAERPELFGELERGLW